MYMNETKLIFFTSWCICKFLFDMNNKRKRKQNDGNERSNDSVLSPLSKQNDNNKPLDEREKCNSDIR